MRSDTQSEQISDAQPPALAVGPPRPADLDLPNSPITLSWGFFWLCALIGAFMPLLPVYLTERGATASDFAFITAVQALTALLVTQVIGYVADAWMRRTTLFMVMCLGGALSAAVFPLLPAHLLGFSLGMVGMSLFFGQRTSIYNSLILDSHRGEPLYPRIRMMGSLGFVLVTPLVGWLADRPSLGPAVIWPSIVIIELIMAAVMLGLTDESASVRQGRAGGRISFRKAQRILFGNRLVLKFLLFIFLMQWVAIPGHVFQSMLLAELGVSSLFITLCLTWAALWELVIFWWGTEIVNRFGVMNLLMIIPVSVAIRFGLIFISPTPAVIFASNTLHFITFGLAYLCGVIFINRETPRELKSSGQAIFQLIFGTVSALVGNIGTAALLKYLTKVYDLSDVTVLTWWFGGAAFVMIFALAAFYPMRREYVRKHGTFVSGTAWRRT